MVAAFRITVNSEKMQKLLRDRGQKLRSEVELSLVELGVIGRSTARKFAPSAFGFLRNSIDYVQSGLRMTLTAGASYAAYVNFGTRPHWTPVNALDEWAKRRGLDDGAKHAVRFSIAHKGTKANPFWSRTTLFLQLGARKYMEAAVQRALRGTA